MSTLLQITENLGALDQLLSELGGDISDEQVAATIDQWLAELDADLKGKVDAYAALIAEKEARAKVRKEEAARLRARAEIDERGADAMRQRLKLALESRNIRKVETRRYLVSVVKNGGKQPLDIHEPTDRLPDWAQKTIVEIQPDREAIRARLEKGESLSFAVLGERGTRLAIR